MALRSESNFLWRPWRLPCGVELVLRRLPIGTAKSRGPVFGGLWRFMAVYGGFRDFLYETVFEESGEERNGAPART